MCKGCTTLPRVNVGGTFGGGPLASCYAAGAPVTAVLKAGAVNEERLALPSRSPLGARARTLRACIAEALEKQIKMCNRCKCNELSGALPGLISC